MSPFKDEPSVHGRFLGGDLAASVEPILDDEQLAIFNKWRSQILSFWLNKHLS